MPMEWEKEEMKWKQPGGTQSSQIFLEGDVIVPDSKPDVDRILSCDRRVRIQEVRTGDDRITLTGFLKLCILYSSAQGEKSVYAMQAVLPIEDVIYMDGLEKDMEVVVTPTLENLDCQVINDRKIGVKAVITLTAAAAKQRLLNAIVPSEMEGVSFQEQSLLLEEEIAQKKEHFTVKDEITVPADAPAIGEILCEGVEVTDLEFRPMDGKVMVRSNLLTNIMYMEEGDGDSLHVLTEKIPFNGYLEADGVTAKSLVEAGLHINDVEVKTALDEDGEPRLVNIQIDLTGELAAWEERERTVVADAYVPGMETEVIRETMTYPVTVGSGRNQFSMKERVTLEKGEMPMLQTKKVWGQVQVQEAKPETDMVQVDGVLSTEMLYLCPDDSHPVQVIQRGIPFSQRVEMKGVTPTDQVQVKGNLEQIDFQMLSEKEGEIFASALLDMTVKRLETTEAVTDIRVKEREKDGRRWPWAIIYTVQKGDTLWNIAKRYDTTLERILMVNPRENPDLIYPGERLLILKPRN